MYSTYCTQVKLPLFYLLALALIIYQVRGLRQPYVRVLGPLPVLFLYVTPRSYLPLHARGGERSARDEDAPTPNEREMTY